MSAPAARWPPDTDESAGRQDANRRAGIARPSSRRAAFKRDPSPGIRIGRPSLLGRKTAAARQIPVGSRAGPRNSSRKMLDRLIGIDDLPVPGQPSENGAGEGIRTLDPNLGKVVLYP